ncbi:hypothetical protein V6N13_122553 [Hibiscus sabdariffa]|uniref:Uncharacterized protein n=1 Tax=Hibiscus sabdariffa TaxID=183260 RepID=A0ABR2Q7J3_9ROSI
MDGSGLNGSNVPIGMNTSGGDGSEGVNFGWDDGWNEATGNEEARDEVDGNEEVRDEVDGNEADGNE